MEASLDLFKKFKDFNFAAGRIARYVEEKPYLFKFMPEEHLLEYQPVTSMTRTPGGYTFTTIKGIRGYLSNLALAGFAHGGRDESGQRILVQGVFDPVIPIDLLEPCYAAVTGHYLDGTPFSKPQESRQFRRVGSETDAILHGLLTSDDGSISNLGRFMEDCPVYACFKGGYFGQKTRVGLNRSLAAWILAVRPVDDIVLSRLIAIAEHDPKLSEKVKAYFAQTSQDAESILTVLDSHIRNTKKALKRVNLTIVALLKELAEEDNEDAETEDGEETITAGLDPNLPIMKEHRQLQATLRNLKRQRDEAARQQNEDPAKSITGFYHTLSHLRTEFHKRPPQDKKDIIRKLVEEVKITNISPHLYTLQITWIRPLTDGRDDVALLWRSDPIRDKALSTWTDKEEALLRKLYPTSPQLTLLRLSSGNPQ